MIRRGFLRLMGLAIAAAGCAPLEWGAHPEDLHGPQPAAPPLWRAHEWWEHESSKGFGVRFRLVALNRKTGERRLNAVRWYSEPGLARGAAHAAARDAAKSLLKGWVDDLNRGQGDGTVDHFFLAGEPKVVHFLVRDL